MVLKEKKVPYELIPVDLSKGEQKKPEYLETKQPFGLVPVLVDGDFTIFESRAISRYIATKYAGRGTPLLPPANDIVKVGKFEQAASIETANFDPFASGIASELVFKVRSGKKPDHNRVEALNATLDAKLDGYERILAKQKYLAGNDVTLADLFHLPYGTMITKNLAFEVLTKASRPNVARWWRDISSREAWLAVEDGA
ncbi:hypothetical protein M422DRAFT_273275 [Sphaerobolus stellatus SS14]|uniref:glutathione transferase n=1 Tax=Sphaerobolus stellatus (strain SS14) TaxID=990650 RepID=A0A0C9UKG8_SPHS4|nr:hypothetical protein M422DRAFT_273275 [Sphaerobolus stellatus SS14]